MTKSFGSAVKHTLFSMLAVLVVAAAFVVVGCKDNPAKPVDPVVPPDTSKTDTSKTDTTKTDTTGALDPALILGNGFAWVGDITIDMGLLELIPAEEAGFDVTLLPTNTFTGAMFFKADGTLDVMVKALDLWYDEVLPIGTWSTAKGKLHIVAYHDGTENVVSYELSASNGNLTIYHPGYPGDYEFVKTKWPVDDIGNVFEFDPDLANTAWVGGSPPKFDENGNLVGGSMVSWTFVYNDDTPFGVGIYLSQEMDAPEFFAWYTSENQVNILTLAEGLRTFDYEVSGGVLSLDGNTFFGGGVMFKTRAGKKLPKVRIAAPFSFLTK